MRGGQRSLRLTLHGRDRDASGSHVSTHRYDHDSPNDNDDLMMVISILVATVAGLHFFFFFNLLVVTQFWHMAPLPACNPCKGKFSENLHAFLFFILVLILNANLVIRLQYIAYAPDVCLFFHNLNILSIICLCAGDKRKRGLVVGQT